jgi:hypothetical protein
MADNVPERTTFSKVAVAARLRALTATPPAPVEGSPPFDHALPNWLAAITPLGADVLYTNQSVLPLTAAAWAEADPPSRQHTTELPGGGRRHHIVATDRAYKPARHPSEAERTHQRKREARIAEAWSRTHALALALCEAGVGPQGMGPGGLRLAETVLWLSRGAVRQPGVPIFDRLVNALPGSGELRLDSLLTGPRFGRNGATALRIECAASHDLAAATFMQLSRAQGWQGHEDPDGKPGNPSQAKRAVREGRQLLHTLGAWPWAHADRGRLHEHPKWWRDPEFLAPLRVWIAKGWGRLMILEGARARNAFDLESKQGKEGQATIAMFTVLENVAADLAVALGGDLLLEQLERYLPTKP